MPDIYYRAVPDEHSQISIAIGNLTACAGRLCYSILLSLDYLPSEVAAHFRQLLTPETLWALGIVLAGWALATLVGGVIGLAVDFLLLAYGLYSLYGQLASTWGSLKEWAVAAYKATNDQELGVSARFFADAVAGGALTILQVLIAHRVFKAVEAPLRRKFPPPDWLKAEYEARTRSASERQANKAREVAGKVREVVGTAKVVGAGGAAADLAKEFPTGAAIAAGLFGLLAIGTTVGIIASESESRKRG